MFKITFADGGKPALDRMFGHLHFILSTAVDAGMDYQNAASIVCAMGYAGAVLTVTTAFMFAAVCCGLAQDLENGYYQELIAFILFLKRQTKAAFDFSSSAGRDKQCVVGGGLPSPTLR